MAKAKKFKRPRIFSKSNLTVVVLAILGFQTYPNFTNQQLDIHSNTDSYGEESVSNEATLIENQIADSFNGRLPFQVNFTDSQIIIRVPKLNLFDFTQLYAPNMVHILKKIQGDTLPRSLKKIRLSVGDQTQVFSISAIKEANFSTEKIKEFSQEQWGQISNKPKITTKTTSSPKSPVSSKSTRDGLENFTKS